VARVLPKSRTIAVIPWLLPGVLLLGCGIHREGQAAERLRARIQAELGSTASVNVRSAYGSTTVTVRLEPLPAGDSKLLQERIEALAKAEFPRTEYVVVLAKP